MNLSIVSSAAYLVSTSGRPLLRPWTSYPGEASTVLVQVIGEDSVGTLVEGWTEAPGEYVTPLNWLRLEQLLVSLPGREVELSQANPLMATLQSAWNSSLVRLVSVADETASDIESGLNGPQFVMEAILDLRHRDPCCDETSLEGSGDVSRPRGSNQQPGWAAAAPWYQLIAPQSRVLKRTKFAIGDIPSDDLLWGRIGLHSTLRVSCNQQRPTRIRFHNLFSALVERLDVTGLVRLSDWSRRDYLIQGNYLALLRLKRFAERAFSRHTALDIELLQSASDHVAPPETSKYERLQCEVPSSVSQIFDLLPSSEALRAIHSSPGASLTLGALSHMFGATVSSALDLDKQVQGSAYIVSDLRQNELLIGVDGSWPKGRIDRSGQERYSPDQLTEVLNSRGGVGIVQGRHREANGTSGILVSNSREFMYSLAKYARATYSGTVIGVTGTVGKTTTKELLLHTLEQHGSVAATRGAANTIDGVAQTLTTTLGTPDYIVIEAAISGFVRRSTACSADLIRPNAAIISAIGMAHLEDAPTLDAMARIKGRLVSALEPGGIAILTRDTTEYMTLAELAADAGAEQVVSFGSHPESDFRLISWCPTETGSEIRISARGVEQTVAVATQGKAFALNLLSVLALHNALGLSDSLLIDRLAEFSPGDRVSRQYSLPVLGGNALLIDDTRNAADLSMVAAFELLSKLGAERGARTVAVVGEIVNLGDSARKVHGGLAEGLLEHEIDLVFTTGREMEELQLRLGKRFAGHAETPEDLAALVWSEVRPGDVILTKGSHKNTGFRKVPRILRRLSRDSSYG